MKIPTVRHDFRKKRVLYGRTTQKAPVTIGKIGQKSDKNKDKIYNKYIYLYIFYPIFLFSYPFSHTLILREKGCV